MLFRSSHLFEQVSPLLPATCRAKTSRRSRRTASPSPIRQRRSFPPALRRVQVAYRSTSSRVGVLVENWGRRRRRKPRKVDDLRLGGRWSRMRFRKATLLYDTGSPRTYPPPPSLESWISQRRSHLFTSPSLYPHSFAVLPQASHGQRIDMFCVLLDCWHRRPPANTAPGSACSPRVEDHPLQLDLSLH